MKPRIRKLGEYWVVITTEGREFASRTANGFEDCLGFVGARYGVGW